MHGLNPIRRHRQGQQQEIELSPVKGLDEGFREVLANKRLEVRVILAQGLQESGQQERRYRRYDTQSQATAQGFRRCLTQGHEVFYKALPCSPCITNFNYKTSFCRMPVCISNIRVEEVIPAASRLIERSRAERSSRPEAV